ncbi:MAG: hypothetical protein Q9168_006420 [Polycauliona sp. 1 TL-2023]
MTLKKPRPPQYPSTPPAPVPILKSPTPTPSPENPTLAYRPRRTVNNTLLLSDPLYNPASHHPNAPLPRFSNEPSQIHKNADEHRRYLANRKKVRETDCIPWGTPEPSIEERQEQRRSLLVGYQEREKDREGERDRGAVQGKGGYEEDEDASPLRRSQRTTPQKQIDPRGVRSPKRPPMTPEHHRSRDVATKGRNPLRSGSPKRSHMKTEDFRSRDDDRGMEQKKSESRIRLGMEEKKSDQPRSQDRTGDDGPVDSDSDDSADDLEQEMMAYWDRKRNREGGGSGQQGHSRKSPTLPNEQRMECQPEEESHRNEIDDAFVDSEEEEKPRPRRQQKRVINRGRNSLIA